jgi:hypothetical protein
MTASDKTEKPDPQIPEGHSPAEPRPPRSFDDFVQSALTDLRERFALGR